jgi:hypothetical protein
VSFHAVKANVWIKRYSTTHSQLRYKMEVDVNLRACPLLRYVLCARLEGAEAGLDLWDTDRADI